MRSKVDIRVLDDQGDRRGFSFTVPGEALTFLGQVADFRIASVLPGAVRGNHCHLRRREVLLVTHEAEWSFHWDEGPDTGPQHRQFAGEGAVMMLLEPGASHAVRNDGGHRLVLATLYSDTYDPQETLARKVV